MISLDPQLPSREGFDLTDPEDLENVFELYDQSLRDMSEQLREQTNNANYITVGGRSLSKNGGPWTPPSGTLFHYHGSWASALSLRGQYGLVICDGRNGTPQHHPNPSVGGSLQRYSKPSAWGCPAGTTGGNRFHDHCFSQPAHQVITIDSHEVNFASICSHTVDFTYIGNHEDLCHSHCVELTTDTSDDTVNVATDGTAVSACSHFHCVTGDTCEALTEDITHGGECELSHGGTQTLNHVIKQNGGAQDWSHSCDTVDSASVDPPHITVIVLMKL